MSRFYFGICFLLYSSNMDGRSAEFGWHISTLSHSVIHRKARSDKFLCYYHDQRRSSILIHSKSMQGTPCRLIPTLLACQPTKTTCDGKANCRPKRVSAKPASTTRASTGPLRLSANISHAQRVPWQTLVALTEKFRNKPRFVQSHFMTDI